jgi:hypothetical protein
MLTATAILIASGVVLAGLLAVRQAILHLYFLQVTIHQQKKRRRK